jgi:ribose 1,5-bisphosphokinase
MPQSSQIIGVNSVTNIDLGKGLMPAPIVRNADWFEKFPLVRINDRFLLPDSRCLKTPEGACYTDSIIVPYLYRIVANGRFTRGIHAVGGVFRMDGTLIFLMGPSGSGKDSLIEAARSPLQTLNCAVVRRVITRSAESVGEDAVGVSQEEFEQRKAMGDFALSWHANGLDYGIPAVVDQWLKDGRHVLVNGSRGHLAQALRRYPTLLPVLLTVKDDVLRARLLRRGREGLAEIDARLRRNRLFTADGLIGDTQIHRLDNSGDLAVTVANLLDLLKANAVPDRI